MVRLTCIYTKQGDKGKTSLGNGQRVKKHDLRIETIGTVDELNSLLGVVILYVPAGDVFTLLRKIQNNLFDIGADLCVPEPDAVLDFKPLRIRSEQIDYIEHSIDHYNATLSALNSFILPGGTKASSYLHFARTVTRRAERLICALKEEEKDSDLDKVLIYMNRLSDLLFVLARYMNDHNDILWQPGE